MQNTEKKYRREFAQKIKEQIIPQEIIDKKNNEKSWEYRYYSEYDVVVISRDGTIGDIYNIEGLLIAIPATPPINKIRFHEFPAHSQKWQRFKVPQDLANYYDLYSPENFEEEQLIFDELIEKHEKFIVEDIQRIYLYGMWHMIDGDPEWIPPGHYFLLQHLYLSTANSYAKFRFIQRDYYMWLEACYADNRCYGSLLLKARQIFFSTVGGSELLRHAMFNNNAFCPIMSKTDNDARRLFDKYVKNPLSKMPIHLLPKIDEKRNSEKRLKFYDPSRKKGRNSIIQVFATVIKGYDGETVGGKSLNDEIGKIMTFDINIWWDLHHKKTHGKGGNIHSKAICGSTSGRQNEGGENYKRFYNNSKFETRNELGQTKTGLYSIFIPSEFSYENFYDEFGHTIYYSPEKPVKNELGQYVEIGSKDYLDMEERSCHTDKELISQKLTAPRTEEDAFLSEEGKSLFDRDKIRAQLLFLQEHTFTPEYRERVFSIDLLWKNGIPDTEVTHKINPNGKYLVSWIPPKEYRSRFFKKGNVKHPLNEWMGAFGIDPYDIRRPIYGSGSKGSIVGKTKSVGDNFPLDTFFLLYNYRPETEDIFYEDMIKVLLFYSMPALIENNKKGLLKTLKKRNYRGFSLLRPDKNEFSAEELEYGGMPSSEYTIRLQETAMETFIASRIGHADSLDECKTLFVPQLEDWFKYDPASRTKFDISVASQLSILANNKIVRKPKIEEQQSNYNPLSYFQTAI